MGQWIRKNDVGPQGEPGEEEMITEKAAGRARASPLCK